jgi:deoxyribonuclease-4
LRLGIHTSVAGSLENSALKAADLGANTFQIFSSSPRMWRASVPNGDAIKRLRAARERFDLRPLAIHVNYLINLASIDPVIRGKSIDGFRGELERGQAIGADYLVLHPGSYQGRTVEEGIASLVSGLREATAGMRRNPVMVLLENTAGAGCQIGSRFEELRAIRDMAANEAGLEIGYCLDTCHLYAAGFNIARMAGLHAMLRQAEETLGLAHVRLIHANDSKGALGSKLDRHAHIGGGKIGRAGFRRILADRRLRHKPFILETPVDVPGDDRRNLDMLKSLALG